LVIDELSRQVHLDGRLVDLTRIEFDLLAVLSSNPKLVITPRQLLSRLWESDFVEDGHPIEVYVHRLRTKLGESGRLPRFIHTVRGVGYRFEPGTSPWQTVTLTYNDDGALVDVRPAVTELWGWRISDIMGKPFTLIDDRTRSEIERLLRTVSGLAELTPRIHIDTHIMQRDGSRIAVDALVRLDDATRTITAVVTQQRQASLPSNCSTFTPANRMRQSLTP